MKTAISKKLEAFGVFIDSFVPDTDNDIEIETDHLTNEQIRAAIAWAKSTHDSEYFGEGYQICF